MLFRKTASWKARLPLSLHSSLVQVGASIDCLAGGHQTAERRSVAMRATMDYLCDRFRGFMTVSHRRLVRKLRWVWARLPRRVLYDLAVNVVANVIANQLLK